MKEQEIKSIVSVYISSFCTSPIEKYLQARSMTNNKFSNLTCQWVYLPGFQQNRNILDNTTLISLKITVIYTYCPFVLMSSITFKLLRQDIKMLDTGQKFVQTVTFVSLSLLLSTSPTIHNTRKKNFVRVSFVCFPPTSHTEYELQNIIAQIITS